MVKLQACRILVVKRCRAAGFTLLELLVVVVIIGLLAALVGPRVFGHIAQSEITTARAQIEAFSRAIEAYRMDMGKFPDAAIGLNALMTAPTATKKWRGPYLLKEIPTDPWGHPYVYRFPGAVRDYQVISFGSDGAEGGEGDAADLVN